MNMQYAAAVVAHENTHRQHLSAVLAAQQRQTVDQRSTAR
jgi:hypothetical protein